MNEQWYRHTMDYLARRPKWVRALNAVNQGCTALGYVAYAVLLISQWSKLQASGWGYIIWPACAFAVLSVLRHLVNRPRPYELYRQTAVFQRGKQGASFPSRHVFSLALIATLWFDLWPIGALFLWVATAVLAGVRVCAGVHYVSDVCVGALCGAGAGILMLHLIA